MDKDRVEDLAAIITKSEETAHLGRRLGEDFLAYLAEQPLHEARSTLMSGGGEPPAPKPPSAEQSDDRVAPLRRPNTPTKPRT